METFPMKTPILAAALLAASLAFPDAGSAQTAMPAHSAGMHHADHAMPEGMEPEEAGPAPTEPGQAAFAAIQEIVGILEADPHTDWTRVDIEALRRHLIDMNNVTLNARVAATPTDRGARFAVTGADGTVGSIRRMVEAHAATMSGRGGWTYAAEEIPNGATLTVTVEDPADAAKVRALGFIGVMTRGMHHQEHHLMIARGMAPHG